MVREPWEEFMKRYQSVFLAVTMLYLAILACSLPGASEAINKADAVSTAAAKTVQQIQTNAGTIQFMGSQVAATIQAEITAKASTPLLKLTLYRANIPRLSTVQPTGSISGAIHHSGLPDAMRIYWREVNTGKVGYIETSKADATYTISGLLPGDYNVVSWYYPQGASGAVTTLNIITAQGSAQQNACTAAVRKIHLDAGQNVTGADIGCWGGDFFSLVTPTAP
jgi:hypothetical protein